jgi:RluA family pseudouridine synthase
MVSPEQDWIIYNDDALLAVNKPAGLPALPDGYSAGAAHVKSLLESEFGRLWIVHRLDRNTSGVMILARTPQAHRALNDQFQSHQAVKVYHAVVIGSPTWEEMVVDLALQPDGDRRHRTVVDQAHGKPAITRLRLLERLGCFSLVEAVPQTGRTHQLRAHLSAVGFPIVCDPLYGGGQRLAYASQAPGSGRNHPPQTDPLERMGLHACRLEIEHPLDHAWVVIQAPYSADLEHTIKILRQNPPNLLELITAPR